MYIKVDYSIDCKKHNYDTNRPGTYAIYTKKHLWSPWVEGATYADLNFCKRDAEKLAELPKYYR